MFNVYWIVLAAAVITGGILYAFFYWKKKRVGEVVPPSFLIALAILVVIYSGLFTYILLNSNATVAQVKQDYLQKEAELTADHERKIQTLKENYAKEMAMLEWKNKVFTSEKDMEKELAQKKAEFKLTAAEERMWRERAADNTLEKLIPKDNSKEILAEYQNRLKKSLSQVKSGQTLLTSDIRLLSDNINTIRLIGKEYEKVLGAFKDLYTDITTNPGGQIVEPKQKYFLFFPVKRKEYESALKEYYQAQGNEQATANVAAKLKVTIEKAEAEFKAINQKFNENLSFLENNNNSITYNSDKLEKLIEAAIKEAEIVNETQSKNVIKIDNKNAGPKQ